jgi:hypothetical protein
MPQSKDVVMGGKDFVVVVVAMLFVLAYARGKQHWVIVYVL